MFQTRSRIAVAALALSCCVAVTAAGDPLDLSSGAGYTRANPGPFEIHDRHQQHSQLWRRRESNILRTARGTTSVRMVNRVTVIDDDGVYGDLPMWMLQRLDRSLTASTRLVIFEPGPNDRSKSRNVDYSERILTVLRDRRIPAIYVSHARIQTEEEATATAAKFGANYYGEYRKGLPEPIAYIEGHHLSGVGTAFMGANMLPLVKCLVTVPDSLMALAGC